MADQTKNNSKSVPEFLLLYRCLAENLSFKNGGGNVLTLCPPLTIAESDLAQALAIVVRAIRAEVG